MNFRLQLSHSISNLLKVSQRTQVGHSWFRNRKKKSNPIWKSSNDSFKVSAKFRRSYEVSWDSFEISTGHLDQCDRIFLIRDICWVFDLLQSFENKFFHSSTFLQGLYVSFFEKSVAWKSRNKTPALFNVIQNFSALVIGIIFVDLFHPRPGRLKKARLCKSVGSHHDNCIIFHIRQSRNFC